MAQYEKDLNLKATELRLGLPGSDEPEKQLSSSVKSNKKRVSPETSEDSSASVVNRDRTPPAKAQVVGWPPVQSFRKNSLKKSEKEAAGMYVKVSIDGSPYLRKIDLKLYKSYPELLEALENMFKIKIGHYSVREGYNGSEYAPTYEDKDGDWMLAGDVPWNMFINSCKRLRIMKGSEARGLGCL
ncbi:auxin-induced protein 22B [Tripterygium wilfordii]|uniref:Auxin-responsive protein n=1 Tax=Tripterygium wilfordii TaxID=458696 RepID=A0A7J7CXZ2_TRIWF|nr:auxin-induced protein 22D-like [Tripterygium wilfordii]KAF5738888.1 auxin-induced protein 22B [Tripterygium wilfordii]